MSIWVLSSLIKGERNICKFEENETNLYTHLHYIPEGDEHISRGFSNLSVSQSDPLHSNKPHPNGGGGSSAGYGERGENNTALVKY